MVKSVAKMGLDIGQKVSSTMQKVDSESFFLISYIDSGPHLA